MQPEAQSSPAFQVAFIDVGQGDCTVAVDDCTNTAIIVDCADGQPAKEYLLPLQQCGVRLRLICITHYHRDHYAGFVDLLPALDLSSLSHVLWSQSFIQEKRQPARARTVVQGIRRTIAERSTCKPTFPKAGDVVAAGGFQIAILHPSEDDLLDTGFGSYGGSSPRNDACIVIRLSCEVGIARYRILIGSDAEAEAWRRMMERDPDLLLADVLRLPHHGADVTDKRVGFSLEELLAAVRPQLAIVSAGAENRYGHPSPKTIAALAQCPFLQRVLCTQPTALCTNEPAAQRPCGGNIVVELRSCGLAILPSLAQHAATISRFATPFCTPSEADPSV